MIEFIMGIMVGAFLSLLIFMIAVSFTQKQQATVAQQAETDRERSDPANWWKYGGDPFGTEED